MEQLTAIFLGPQGSGKGTQVTLLKEYLKREDSSRDVVSFEAGARLRAFGSEGGHTQDIVDASLKRGELQPDFVTLYLMSKLFFEELKGNEHLIIDGFPRTREQQAIFDGAMKFYGRAKPAVLYVTVSDEEAVTRLLKRGRNDDTEEGIRKRLAWNRQQVAPAVEWFRTDPHYNFFEINGERSIEDINKDIFKVLNLP